MQLLGTTIESWPDVQFVARQRDFRFTEIWNQRKELMKISHNEDFFTNYTVLGLTQEIKQNEQNAKEGRWTFEEHYHFLEAISKYGSNWKKIEEAMITKARTRL